MASFVISAYFNALCAFMMYYSYINSYVDMYKHISVVLFVLSVFVLFYIVLKMADTLNYKRNEIYKRLKGFPVEILIKLSSSQEICDWDRKIVLDLLNDAHPGWSLY